jgi:hypothetical protein
MPSQRLPLDPGTVMAVSFYMQVEVLSQVEVASKVKLVRALRSSVL